MNIVTNNHFKNDEGHWVKIIIQPSNMNKLRWNRFVCLIQHVDLNEYFEMKSLVDTHNSYSVF